MLNLYTDADMAGDAKTNRSTSGVYVTLEGRRTRMAIAASSKRQTAVSHSTPEAEIVAGCAGLRLAGLPAQVFWTAVLGHLQNAAASSNVTHCVVSSNENELSIDFGKVLVFWGDNESMIQVCRTGKNPTMRYLGRTHRVSISELHEICADPAVWLRYITTDKMCADIFTKHFSDRKRTIWKTVRQNINVFDPEELEAMCGAPGVGYETLRPELEERCTKHRRMNPSASVIPFNAMAAAAPLSMSRLATLPIRIWKPRGPSRDACIEKRIKDMLACPRLNFEYDIVEVITKSMGLSHCGPVLECTHCGRENYSDG